MMACCAMKKLIIILVAVLLTVTVCGQNKGALSYQDQYVKLYKEFTKDPSNVVNLIDMAKFFADESNPQFNLALSVGYIRQADTIFAGWLTTPDHYRQANKYIRKGVSIWTIRQLNKDINAQAASYVKTHLAEIRPLEAAALISAFPKNSKVVNPLKAKNVADQYGQASAENTIESYYAFLKNNTNSYQADWADSALAQLGPRFFSMYNSEAVIDSVASLYSLSRAMQTCAMRQKSRIAYAQACRINTVESYSAYLERYPRGVDYLDALSRLQAMRNVDFGTITSAEELASFVEGHEDDPLADSALARLRSLVFDQHSQEAAQIYLGRFPLDESYNKVYKEYYSWHSSEGNVQPIESFAQTHPDYPYQLSVASDLALGRKIDMFDLTRPFQESEFDTMTSVVRLLTGRKVAFVALQRILQRQIASKDWANASRRLQQFSLCFEDVSNEQYEELSSLIATPSSTALTHFLSADSMSHAISRSATLMYFTRPNHGVFMARYSGGKKGTWKTMGRVTIEGADGSATAYNFYDKGRKVLLGISGDIWTADVVNDTLWKLSQHLPYPVNTPYLECDAFMLADGSGILLASDRPMGHNVQQSGSYFHGDTKPATDIYYIPFTSGRWDDAVNLGISINSPYCELSPILSRNMRTLYFVTDARGFGYGDVYRTTRTDIDDWTHWAKPVNMGRGVNGAFDEASISFSPSEKHVLLTAHIGRSTQSGAFSFGTTHDTASAYRHIEVDFAPVMSIMRNADLAMVWNNTLGNHVTDRQLDSVQSYSLYKGKEYAVVVEADWLYVPTLFIDGKAEGRFELRGYGLDELKKMSEPVPMPLVRFYEGTSRMLPLAEVELRHLGRYLQQRTASRIELESHLQGNDSQQSYELSLERAKAVRAFLVEYGVDADRIRISAYGNVMHKNGQNPSPIGLRFF